MDETMVIFRFTEHALGVTGWGVLFMAALAWIVGRREGSSS